jgi:predicted MFS family arabinose efflux permease
MAWIARTSPKQSSGPVSLQTVFENFRAIFAHRSVKYCFGAVMIEGWILFGLFPFVSLILLAAGEQRSSIAGLVLAAYGIGSLCYSFVISRLMKIATEKQLMIGGSAAIAAAYAVMAFGVSWPVMAAAMFVVGLSFFMVHGWIQIHISEILPAARGASLSLHAFFLFLGAALGPIMYSLMLPELGLQTTLLINAVVFLLMGIVTAKALTRHTISHSP